MGKSLIQIVNTSTQAVAVDGTISLGTALRRYGCNLRLNGNAIEAEGAGYYTIDGTVTVAPTAAGVVTVAVYVDGLPLAGATASANVATAGNAVTLPLCGTIRQGCCYDSANSITVVLESGAGNVTNVSLRVEKS